MVQGTPSLGNAAFGWHLPELSSSLSRRTQNKGLRIEASRASPLLNISAPASWGKLSRHPDFLDPGAASSP